MRKWWIIVPIMLLAGCHRDELGVAAKSGCESSYDPAADYFPERITVRYATQFRVEYHKHYKVVEFNPSVDTGEKLRFVLVQCGAPVPAHRSSDYVVRVPARTFVSTNLGYNSTIERLGLTDRLVGLSSLRPVTSPGILAAIKQGAVREMGAGVHANIEKTLALNPDLLFTYYSAYPQYNMHPKLWGVGIQAVPLSDHTEPHPLGKTEWIKFIALFFNRDGLAEKLFHEIEGRYLALAEKTKNVEQRPHVLLGWNSSRDIWSLHGGRNYMAQLLWDAGARYFWQDEIRGSLVYANLERVFDLSFATDTWISGGFLPATLRLMRASNAIVGHLSPVQRASVFSPDKGVARFAPSPFGDQTLDKPDAVLADLVQVFHPRLLPGREPVYYRRIPE